jgi:hypothetical protein
VGAGGGLDKSPPSTRFRWGGELEKRISLIPAICPSVLCYTRRNPQAATSVQYPP